MIKEKRDIERSDVKPFEAAAKYLFTSGRQSIEADPIYSLSAIANFAVGGVGQGTEQSAPYLARACL